MRGGGSSVRRPASCNIFDRFKHTSRLSFSLEWAWVERRLLRLVESLERREEGCMWRMAMGMWLVGQACGGVRNGSGGAREALARGREWRCFFLVLKGLK